MRRYLSYGLVFPWLRKALALVRARAACSARVDGCVLYIHAARLLSRTICQLGTLINDVDHGGVVAATCDGPWRLIRSSAQRGVGALEAPRARILPSPKNAVHIYSVYPSPFEAIHCTDRSAKQSVLPVAHRSYCANWRGFRSGCPANLAI